MNDLELARELDAVVLAVDGVLQSYDARPAALAAVRDAASALLRVERPEPVAVRRSAEGISVSVSIAVTDARPAADTCRDVYAAVVQRLEQEAGATGAAGIGTVSVQVGRIG